MKIVNECFKNLRNICVMNFGIIKKIFNRDIFIDNNFKMLWLHFKRINLFKIKMNTMQTIKKRPNDGHLNNHPKSWMMSLLVGIALLFSTQAKAQIWASSHYSPNIYYYDIAANTWTLKTTQGAVGTNSIYWIAYRNGILYAVRSASLGGVPTSPTLYKYVVATNTWTLVGSNPLFANRFFFVDDNTLIFMGGQGGASPYIYTISPASGPTSIYSTITNNGVTGFNGGSCNNANFFDGTDIYIKKGLPDELFTYNPATNSINPVTTFPTSGHHQGSAAKVGGNIYYSTQTGPLYKYDVATQTNTQVQVGAQVGNRDIMASDGTNLFGVSGTTTPFYQYNFTTNAWVTRAVIPYSLGFQCIISEGEAAPLTPTATASAVAATCTGTTTNSNAQLVLTAFTGATKVGYSIGSTYTGPDFASATTLTAAPFTVVNNLPNPTVNQPYTIRAFVSATSYIDRTVLISPTNCTSADLSLTVATATQTGNKGETLTYTFTLTNNGPNDVSDAMANINIPSNVTLLNASPSQGTYTENTKLWNVGAVANGGSKTLVISVKVN